MLQNKEVLFFACAVLLLLGAAFFFLGLLFARLGFNSELKAKIEEARSDAVKRSRAVLGGLAGEQLAPFLPGFPCNAADARFVGKPVDFVAFPGAAEGEEIKEILFIEVKSGGAALSPRERQIRDCIKNGRVGFVQYDIPS